MQYVYKKLKMIFIKSFIIYEQIIFTQYVISKSIAKSRVVSAIEYFRDDILPNFKVTN